MNQKEILQKILQKIEDVEKNPVSLFGQEIGSARHDGKSNVFRLFFEEIEESKSGKAVLGKLTAVMKSESLESDPQYTYVQGITYIPKFALQNPLWVLEKKVHNSENPQYEMFIDNSYVPQKQQRSYFNYTNYKSPEDKGKEYVKSMRHMLESIPQ